MDESGRMTSQIVDGLSSSVLLEWEECAKLPVQMRNAQAVLMKDMLYVGGGLTQKKLKEDEAKLYVYTPTSGNWGKAIDTPTYWFALVVYRSQLVLVGGREYDNSSRPGPHTNTLWTLNELNSLWQETSQLPPMITKRHSASAVSHADCLLVAGGHYGSETATLQEEDALQDVEVFNGQQWATTQPLPKPCWHMKSTTFRGKWYLIGGYGQENEVYCTSLDSLIASCRSDSSQEIMCTWKQLPEISHRWASPIVLPGNKLITIGGEDTAAVLSYSFQTKKWSSMGGLPANIVSNACTIILPTGEVMVIGGEGHIFECLNSVFKATPILKIAWQDAVTTIKCPEKQSEFGASDVVTQELTSSVGIKEQLKLMDDEIAKFATKENDSKLGDESIHHLEEDMASLKIKEEMKDEATGEVKSNVAARDIPRKVMIQHNIAGWNLRGVQDLPAGEVTEVIHSEAKSFCWEHLGLKLHFQKDSLPEGMEQCILKVKASLTGQYEFPDDSYLVSPIFWLRCEPMQKLKFTKPVTIEIQHCAKPENSSKLSFVRAVCTQEHLPYAFKRGLEGSFSSCSSYGIVKLNSFSGLGIVQEGLPDKQYCSWLYYLNESSRTEIHFVVTWNTKLHRSEIENDYNKRKARLGSNQTIEFESDVITLDIPLEGTTINGWIITPLIRPVITKRDVDSFEPGLQTPRCLLNVDFMISGRRKRLPPLKHQVILQGARYPHNMFTIELQAQEVTTIKRAASTVDCPASCKRNQSEGDEPAVVESTPFNIGDNRRSSSDSIFPEVFFKPGLDAKLTLDRHHHKVTNYLKAALDDEQIRYVGGALGLTYSNLNRMTTPGEMVPAAWLKKENYVLQVSGQPTWQSLVKALREIGQEGLARDIEKEERRA